GSAVLKKQEEIWGIGISMVNEITDVQVKKRELTIRSDGRIRWRGFFSAHLAAHLDLRQFPFDFQILPIQVESLTWDEEILTFRIVPDEVGVRQDFELAEWEVGNSTREVKSVTRETGEQFSRLEITTTVHRRVGYYLWKMILPLILIVGLGWTVFWIPDGITACIRLSATVMLTIVAFQFALASDLPKVHYVTFFSAFMTLSFLIVALCVLINLFVFYRKDQGNETIVIRSDHLCRWLIPSIYLVSLLMIGFIYLS
ncbi:MAG: hypothetical protein JRC77_04975, partial [Deltaproteobacteria bacterium]|nr:hypothetical protein [Deltaproteobacteria bacterium]